MAGRVLGTTCLGCECSVLSLLCWSLVLLVLLIMREVALVCGACGWFPLSGCCGAGVVDSHFSIGTCLRWSWSPGVQLSLSMCLHGLLPLVSLPLLFSSTFPSRPSVYSFLHACCMQHALHALHAGRLGDLLAGWSAFLHFLMFALLDFSCGVRRCVVSFLQSSFDVQPLVFNITDHRVSPPGGPFRVG